MATVYESNKSSLPRVWDVDLLKWHIYTRHMIAPLQLIIYYYVAILFKLHGSALTFATIYSS